jgi:broad specificity phosphatase PhoE
MPPCPAPDTCLALLIRHGATANNVCRPVRLQGRGSDLPLSPEGIRQAEETGRFLADMKLDAVFASPLLRAQQTAIAIAGPHRLSVQTIEPLTEVDVGTWEGYTWEDIERRWPAEHRQFMDDPATFPYLGGESLDQVQQRVRSVFNELLRSHLGQTIALVTHNVVNRVLLAPLLGTPLKAARGIHQDNCGINVVAYRDGRAKLITLNSVLHLSERY